VSDATVHTEQGDRQVAAAWEILRTVVGSGVHGIAIAGTDDHDEMGVFVEPPGHVLGLGGPVDHYVYRTQPEGARSGPGDTDLLGQAPRTDAARGCVNERLRRPDLNAGLAQLRTDTSAASRGGCRLTN
jgi:hypothetical protein